MFTHHSGRTVSCCVNVQNSADQQNCNYTYDDLARVHSVSCTGNPWSQTFSFDVYGNVQKSGTSSWLPNYDAKTNRYSAISGCPTFSYDNDGNLTNDCAHTYSYDADGHATVINNPFETDQVYDAAGNTAEVSLPAYGITGQNLLDENGLKLAASGAQASAEAFIPLPGGAIAHYYNGALPEYWHADWQGSIRLASKTTQVFSEDVAYGPYGEMYAGTSNGWLEYAQMQHVGDDVYHTMFREYQATQGRWTRPDPAGMAAVDATNPQTWNRYAYVGNNPLIFTDPLGLLDDPDCNHTEAGCGGGGGGGGDDGGGGWGEWGGADWGPEGPWGDGVNYAAGGGQGAGVAACGVDPFCIQRGGIGPFGSPVAHGVSWVQATIGYLDGQIRFLGLR